VGERHESAVRTQDAAPLDGENGFRAVRAIDPGDLSAATLSLRRDMPDPRADDWSAELAIEVGAFAESYYIRPVIGAAVRRSSADHARDLLVRARAGLTSTAVPSQRLFVLGGSGTLPGYAFRSFAGTRFALLEATASQGVLDPWIRLRATAAVGAATGLRSSTAEPRAWQTWGVAGTDGLRASAGGGLSLFWDLLRIDGVRGLNGGDWRILITFHPDLHDIS
jgi:hypothetical protein